MPACPVCGEPDGQLLGTAVTTTSRECRQLDNLRCTRCEYEWQVEHRPPEQFHPFSTPELELADADAV